MSMSGYYNIEAGGDAESTHTSHRALDLGVTHIDTAGIYGPCPNQELVGRAIKDRRSQVMLATKSGIVSHSRGGPGVPDCGATNIRAAVEGSLKRLGTGHIRLHYQHRVDPKTPIEDTVGSIICLTVDSDHWSVFHAGNIRCGWPTGVAGTSVFPGSRTLAAPGITA